MFRNIRQNDSHQKIGLSDTNRSNIRHNESQQKIGVSDTNRTNVNNWGCSVPHPIANCVEGGGTVSDITQSPRIQDMIPLKEFQLMETTKKNSKENLKS